MTIGFEMKKALVLWKSDNNKNANNNVGSAWEPVSGSSNNNGSVYVAAIIIW